MCACVQTTNTRGLFLEADEVPMPATQRGADNRIIHTYEFLSRYTQLRLVINTHEGCALSKNAEIYSENALQEANEFGNHCAASMKRLR